MLSEKMWIFLFGLLFLGYVLLINERDVLIEKQKKEDKNELV